MMMVSIYPTKLIWQKTQVKRSEMMTKKKHISIQAYVFIQTYTYEIQMHIRIFSSSMDWSKIFFIYGLVQNWTNALESTFFVEKPILTFIGRVHSFWKQGIFLNNMFQIESLISPSYSAQRHFFPFSKKANADCVSFSFNPNLHFNLILKIRYQVLG